MTKKQLNKHLDKLNQPDNKRLKRVADTLLYTMPLLSAAIVGSPFPDKVQSYIIFGLNLVIIGFKGFTKFTTDQDV